jgi:hypothetical protein
MPSYIMLLREAQSNRDSVQPLQRLRANGWQEAISGATLN